MQHHDHQPIIALALFLGIMALLWLLPRVERVLDRPPARPEAGRGRTPAPAREHGDD